jgi:hypothetical protein
MEWQKKLVQAVEPPLINRATHQLEFGLAIITMIGIALAGLMTAVDQGGEGDWSAAIYSGMFNMVGISGLIGRSHPIQAPKMERTKHGGHVRGYPLHDHSPNADLDTLTALPRGMVSAHRIASLPPSNS